MKPKVLFLVSLVILAMSCHKESNISAPGNPGGNPGGNPPPPPPPPPALVKLKDLNARNLPSPFYHFDYNNEGQITLASFSSGLARYEVNYSGKNISFMLNNTGGPNRDRLEYHYTNGDVTEIDVIDRNDVNYRRCLLTYNSPAQLLKIEWQVKATAAGFSSEETQEFTYYADGNVKEVKTHFFAVGPLTDQTFTDKYEDYDDKVCAEGFSLMHTSSIHHMILLPAVKIQLNNPRHVTHTGDGANYTVQYSFTYDAEGRPIVKDGDFVYTNGANNGQHTQIQSTFSYY